LVNLRTEVQPLEFQFQRELNLARRTEVASREPRALDFSEGAACGGKDRIAEVWMVEDIKQFAPELQVELLRQLCILDH
jgi:hypothetical protein